MKESDIPLQGLPGAERGHPHYFRDPMIDHLLEVVLRLGAELWVIRDRQALTEHLLATEGRVTAERLEEFKPPPELATKLSAERQALLDRVYGCIYDGLGDTAGKAFEPSVLGLNRKSGP